MLESRFNTQRWVGIIIYGLSLNFNFYLTISIMIQFSFNLKILESWNELNLFSRCWGIGKSLSHIWVNMGWKKCFFHKSSKVIFFSSLTISDGSRIKIWYLKLISDLKKMRFLILSKIEILSPNPSEMMTLRLQILNFLCCADFFLLLDVYLL